jgi:hypothetical protein
MLAAFEGIRWRGRRYVCSALEVMQHRDVLNYDLHIGPILASTVKPLGYR